MAAIPVVGNRTVAQHLLQEDPTRLQAERVAESTRGIFQQMKQTIALFWEAAVFCITQCCTDVAFLFFRTLEFFNPPTLTSRIELVWVYSTKHWNDFWARRAKEENYALTNQNLALEGRIRQLDAEVRHVSHRLQCEEMGKNILIQEKNRLMEDCKYLRRENEAIGRDRDSVVRENRLLVQQSSSIEHKDTDGLAAVRKYLSTEEDRLIMQLLGSAARCA